MEYSKILTDKFIGFVSVYCGKIFIRYFMYFLPIGIILSVLKVWGNFSPVFITILSAVMVITYEVIIVYHDEELHDSLNFVPFVRKMYIK